MILAKGEDKVSWNFFMENFQRKYLRKAQLSGKVQEFMNIKQGRLTVTEYVTKLNELARFVPTIVPTDDARKRKFIVRLRVEIAK